MCCATVPTRQTEHQRCARVTEQVDVAGLKPAAARRTGSIPVPRTNNENSPSSVLLDGLCLVLFWRRDPESNRTRRICNPLHNRFAIAPRSGHLQVNPKVGSYQEEREALGFPSCRPSNKTWSGK
jgi:hypothetical protein